VNHILSDVNLVYVQKNRKVFISIHFKLKFWLYYTHIRNLRLPLRVVDVPESGLLFAFSF
jgi:hypothetical protein